MLTFTYRKHQLLLFFLACAGLLFLGGGGCGHTNPQANTAPASSLGKRPTLSEITAGHQSILSAAGHRAAVVVLIDPGKWRALADGVAELISRVPAPMIKGLDQVLSARDPWSAVGTVVSRLRSLKKGVWPRRLPGLDLSRPMAMGLWEPRNGQYMAAARLLMLDPAMGWTPEICHRAVLPSKDPKVTAAALIDLLARLGLKAETRQTGTSGIYRASSTTLIAVVPGEGHVRVELLSEALPMRYPPPSADKEAQLRRLLAPPEKKPLPLTPALRHLIAAAPPLGLHFRPWILRELSVAIGLRQIAAATYEADPAMKMTLVARGFSEVTTGWLMSTPLGAEIDDIALFLQAKQGGLILDTRWSLSQLGLKAYRAGTTTARQPIKLKDSNRTLIRGWMAFDLSAAVLAAGPFPLRFLTRKDRILDLGRIWNHFREGGHASVLHSSMVRSLGWLRAVSQTKQARRLGLQELLPGALSLGLDIQVKPYSWQWQLALAARLGAGMDLAPLLDQIKHLNSSSNTKRKVDLHSLRQGDTTLLMVGTGQDPRLVFNADKQEQVPPGVLVELELNMDHLINAAGKVHPLIGQPLLTLDTVQSRISLEGPTLHGELMLQRRGAPRLSFRKIKGEAETATPGRSWSSPGLAWASSAGGRCLTQMSEGMVQAFAALAMAAPEQKNRFLLQAWEEELKNLPCAEKDPLTQNQARSIRRTWDHIRAQLLGYHRQRAQQQALLAGGCKAGDRWACHEQARAAKQPYVSLPKVTTLKPTYYCSYPLSPPLFFFEPERPLWVLSSGQAREEPSDWEYYGNRRLEVDKMARWGKVARALKGAMTDQRFDWRIVYTDKESKLRMTPVAQPARVAPGDPPPRSKPVLLTLRPSGEVRIKDGGQTLRVRPTRSCRRGQVCVDRPAVKSHLAKLAQASTQRRLLLHLPAHWTWQQVLPLVVTASCSYGADRVNFHL